MNTSDTAPPEGPVVLVVDDELVSRTVTAHILRRAGYQVLEADGVPAAVDLCDTAPVSLVICDLDMPGGSGLDLAHHLRTSAAGIPFILLSGVDDASLATVEAQGGVDAHLTKPVGSRELRDCVDRVLAARPRT